MGFCFIFLGVGGGDKTWTEVVCEITASTLSST